ncbi:hypothetical protein [Fibrivirga algicola]|uniref:Lipoprotein n=1 Tax=Fibrivirga algicola TaxID=2950420 RepID=A0ABX0QDG5_9BACT|nr:hypothetical protein [Fibrivirga algicola]NID10204.1 hypothetical protein [Fibrivirga algicola]
MKHKYHLGLLIAVVIQLGCSQRATIHFTQKPPELISADALTEIMLVNKSPRIVLRVPNTRKGVTNTQGTVSSRSEVASPPVRLASNTRLPLRAAYSDAWYDETSLYNAIEKQLFKEGFSVRDRGLFNEVLDGAQNANYSKINALTDTDLILELVRLDFPVGYSTNVCFVEPDNEKRLINEYRTEQGASVEFKLVHVKTNEIVGTYKLYYTPCLTGCRGFYKKTGAGGIFSAKGWLRPSEQAELQRNARRGYQTFDQDELETFITDATRQLISSMR